MRRLALVAIAGAGAGAVLLGGCVSAHFYRPGTTLEAAIADCQECNAQAEKAARSDWDTVVYACMQDMGYLPYETSKLPEGVRKTKAGKWPKPAYQVAGD